MDIKMAELLNIIGFLVLGVLPPMLIVLGNVYLLIVFVEHKVHDVIQYVVFLGSVIIGTVFFFSLATWVFL